MVTTTTHLGSWQAEFADQHIIVARAKDVERLAGQIEGVILITGGEGPDNRLLPVEKDVLDALYDLSNRLSFSLLIEADGSRQRPLKAPAPYEPVIPSWVDGVVVVAGLSGLGQPLGEAVVHRPELFALLSRLEMGDPITADALSSVLVNPDGGLKGIPEGASKSVLLSQVEDHWRELSGIRIANQVIPYFNRVIISSLKDQQIRRVVEPIAGIILAGGGSSRFGQPKMLLPWNGKPMIRTIVETALGARLDPVIVVVGAEHESINHVLADLPVLIVPNPDWQQGQSTSVRLGVQSLPEKASGALFLLADQPFVTEKLIELLVVRHQETLTPVTAPRVNGQRANPILFDQAAFHDLLLLTGDTGGRAILNRYPVDFIDWDDHRLLLDIDTPEDYQNLQRLGK